MTMNSDAFFTIGSTHQVCQDYAMAEDDIVVLSDGCSSAQNSDWGARLLVRTCFNELKKTKPDNLTEFLSLVLKNTHNIVQTLELNDDCLAATLLGAYVKNNMVHAFVTGDGYIVARRRKEKNLVVLGWSYQTNAPYYLYYNLNKTIKDSYYKYFGGGKVVFEKFTLENEELKEEYLDKNRTIFNNELVLFPVEEYDMIAVISDGLNSFIKQTKEKTSIVNCSLYIECVLNDLFKFKTLEGKFIHRRCQWFLKDYLSKNIKHTDDFSIGILNVT